MSIAKKCTALLCATGVAVSLGGCSSGGSIYSNYRETEELMIVQTMGFDRAGDDIRLSVSAGASGSSDTSAPDSGSGTSALLAQAPSVSLAMDKMQDHSAREDLFFAHTAYIVIGEAAARDGLDAYLSFVKRSVFLRLDVPVFAVLGGEASELILGAENEQYSATEVLRSLERNVKLRGDCMVTSAGMLSASLAETGGALICAVRLVDAGDTVSGVQALTALPAGYAVIKGDRMVGELPMEYARGAALLMNKSGPSQISISTGSCTACVQFDESSAELEPVTEQGELTGIDIHLTLSASLIEFDGDYDDAAANAALGDTLREWIGAVLDAAVRLRCDFLRLGCTLEHDHPERMRGMTRGLEQLLPLLQYNIYVDTEISRSFDLALPS